MKEKINNIDKFDINNLENPINEDESKESDIDSKQEPKKKSCYFPSVYTILP